MESKPLLPPGIHTMTINAVKELCVINRPNNTRRIILWEKFERFISKISEFRITFTLWIDGSFITEKETPGDIDLVCLCHANDFDKLTADKQKEMAELLNTAKHNFSCDAYFTPHEDPVFPHYWLGFFTFDRNRNPKGLIEIIYGDVNDH